MQSVKTFFVNEEGATLIEYSFLVAMIALAAMSAMSALGQVLAQKLGIIAVAMN